MTLEAWFRLPENSNEDIQRYRGVELMYSYPWREHLRWFITGRKGYGHSLIEYNERTERIGVSITLENLMDKNDNL